MYEFLYIVLINETELIKQQYFNRQVNVFERGMWFCT